MNEIKIEMNKMIKDVHNRIAVWVTEFNQGREGEGSLKIISQEIVEQILKETANSIGGKSKTGIEMDEIAAKNNINKEFSGFQKDLQKDQENGDGKFSTKKGNRFS